MLNEELQGGQDMNGTRGRFDGRSGLAGLLAVAVIVAVAGCAPQKAQDSPELAAASGQWLKAYNAGDAQAIAALYTEDCRIMPPGAELMEGRDAAAASFAEMIASGAKLDLQSIQAVAGGDIGYNVGRYVMSSRDGAVVERGKYMEAWRKTPAGWRIASDIWNADAPAAPAGATMIFTHKVKDGAHWLAGWESPDGRRKLFAEHGVTSVRVFQDPKTPNQTALLVQVTDPEAFTTFITSPEVEKAKAEDGVINSTMMAYTEVK